MSWSGPTGGPSSGSIAAYAGEALETFALDESGLVPPTRTFSGLPELVQGGRLRLDR